MFGRKKNDSDTLVLDEGEEFYNPPASGTKREIDDSELLPVDDDDDLEPEEDEDDSPKKRRKKAKRYGRVAEDEEDEVEEEPDESEWPSPVKPSLSLPSRSIVESTLRDGAAIRMRKVMVIVGAGLAAALVTCGGLNLYSSAQLDGERNKGMALSKGVQDLKPVSEFLDGYADRKKAVSEVLATDIQFSSVQTSLFNVAKQNSITVSSETIVPGKPCASLDPFTAAEGLGCVTAEIDGSSTGSLAKMVDDINKEKGIAGAYISGITSKGDKSTAKLSFNYGNELLSERFKKFGGNSDASKSKDAKPTTPPSSKG